MDNSKSLGTGHYSASYNYSHKKPYTSGRSYSRDDWTEEEYDLTDD